MLLKGIQDFTNSYFPKGLKLHHLDFILVKKIELGQHDAERR